MKLPATTTLLSRCTPATGAPQRRGWPAPAAHRQEAFRSADNLSLSRQALIFASGLASLNYLRRRRGERGRGGRSDPDASCMVMHSAWAAPAQAGHSEWSTVTDEPRATTLSSWSVPKGDASSVVVSRLLEAVASLMLAERDEIRSQVSCNFGQLARGGIGAALLTGRGWQTPLGMTAREIQILVPEAARLNYSALLRGRLALTEPAKGRVEIVFDEADFGNFLVYPKIAAITQSATGPFLFSKQGVKISRNGARFLGRHHGQQVEAFLHCGPASDLIVDVHGAEEDEVCISQSLTSFFRRLSFELAGMDLHLEAVDIVERREGYAVRVRFEGRIVKIPDPLREQI